MDDQLDKALFSRLAAVHDQDHLSCSWLAKILLDGLGARRVIVCTTAHTIREEETCASAGRVSLAERMGFERSVRAAGAVGLARIATKITRLPQPLSDWAEETRFAGDRASQACIWLPTPLTEGYCWIVCCGLVGSVARSPQLSALRRSIREYLDRSLSLQRAALNQAALAAIASEAEAPAEDRTLSQRLTRAREAFQLSPKQLAALEHLVNGASNQEIAARLPCAPRTAEIHVAALLKKTRAGSRTELTTAFWRDW